MGLIMFPQMLIAMLLPYLIIALIISTIISIPAVIAAVLLIIGKFGVSPKKKIFYIYASILPLFTIVPVIIISIAFFASLQPAIFMLLTFTLPMSLFAVTVTLLIIKRQSVSLLFKKHRLILSIALFALVILTPVIIFIIAAIIES